MTANEILAMPVKELLSQDPMWIYLLSRMTIIPSGCWIMEGGQRGGARDVSYYDLTPTRRMYGARAHQAAYFLWRGEIKRGEQVHHICENTYCINPDHLEALNKGAHAFVHRKIAP